MSVAVLASGGTLAAPDADSASTAAPAWSISAAARLVALHHVARFPLASLPTEHESFLRFLVHEDPHAELVTMTDRDIVLGVFLVGRDAASVLVPLQGGAAWRQGVARPVLLTDKAALAEGRVVGRYLDSDERVEVQVDRTSMREGETERHRLGRYGMLRILAFVDGRTVDSVLRALRRPAAAEPAAGEGGGGSAASVDVLDLRYCGGGDVLEATDLASLWLGAKRPWLSIERAGRDRLELSAGPRVADRPKPPRVVLVSEYTASACEQLVQGLKTYGKAVIVGRRTAGKCSVQTTFPLDRAHAIRFTTGTWRGPGGEPCDEEGIVPDRIIEGNVHAEKPVLAALRALDDGTPVEKE